MTTSSTSLSIYQLRIVLRGISQLVWRRVLVHHDTTLAHLHAILQILRSYVEVETGKNKGTESPWGGKTLCLSHSG